MTSEKIIAWLNIIDPCIDPKGIVAPEQINPPAYLYDRKPFSFTPYPPFESVPPGCDITYTCLGTDSLDVRCFIPLVTTFDEIDGTWTFQTSDMEKYPVGTYKVTLQGTTGINSFKTATAPFELTLENPCQSAELLLKAKQPLKDIKGMLRDPREIQ